MISALRKLCPKGALLGLLLLAASAPAAETRGLRYPSLLPGGQSVVFCYRGDIWIAPVDGKGPARRLTIHEEQDTLPRTSPDGKQVAFSSDRSGGYQIYIIPVTGGEPKQVTFHSAGAILCDWSPDGKRLLFVSNRNASASRLNLYELDLAGGTPRQITFDGGRDGAYSPDGSRIVYVRGFAPNYQDNYRGSANYDIYEVAAKGGTPRRVTHTPGNERWPYYERDSKTICFLAEENGVKNFYAMPIAGGKRTQVTRYKPNDVERPDLAWDAKTAVFEIVGRLFTVDLTAPKAKPTPIPLFVHSDMRSSGVVRRTITSGGEQVNVSPDGRNVALTVRGDIWIMPASGGEAKRVTQGPANDQWPRFSPDSKRLTYFSNERGNNDIYLLDLASGKKQPLTTHRADDFFQSWSANGKAIVFTSTRSGNKDIWRLELGSGQLTQLTRNPAGDDDPCYSTDGRFIAFDSARDGAQAVYVMKADGSDLHRVTQGSGNYQVPSFSPDGQFLVYERYEPMTGRSSGLYVSLVTGGASMQVARDGSTACWSPDGEWIYFTARRRREDAAVFRVRAPKSIVAGERVPFLGHVEVDKRKELANLFDEAWTALKDNFYDSKMHGVNWKAMKSKYRAMAIDTENKDEFQNVIRQMLAELGASHLGIYGGTRDTAVKPPRHETGQLGLAFVEQPLENGARRVASVVPGGPADKAGLRRGDVILRIGNTKLKARTNLDTVLRDTVGKPLPVRYRPLSEGSLGIERTVPVEPISQMQLWQLNNKLWEATCARRVKEGTSGKRREVGYIHLSAMDPSNLQKFQQAVQRWNNNRKVKGMILDVRNNGGGNIHLQLMSVFFARPLARVQMRGRPKITQPGLYWDKPVVLLINERSFSDAEVFPYMFKVAGIGKVIGVPTGGGVIGTNDITLSDGSRFRIPRTGFWGLDGTNLEGLGVKPDILVEETSADRLAGRDPQLEKAIETILAEIAGQAKAAKPVAKKKPAPQPKPAPTAKPPEAHAPAPERPSANARSPLSDAAVGEWVRYRASLPDGTGETLFTVRVVRVDKDTVEFATEIEKGGVAVLPLPDKLRRVPVLETLPTIGKVMSHAYMPEAKVKQTPSDLLVARVRMEDATELQLFFSDLVPAYGLWKVEVHDRVILEALEWGRAAPKPSPAPAEVKPEATAEKHQEIPPHPIHDAKVGEWTKVRQFRNGQEMEVTQKVVEVDDESVTLEMSVVFHGQSRTFPPVKRPLRKLLKPRGDREATYGKETLTVNGETLECIVMTFTGRNGGEEKVWVCPKIPVDGLVKVERDGQVVAQLLEWGTEG